MSQEPTASGETRDRTKSIKLSWSKLATGACGGHAGLILLYSPHHAHLPPGYLLRSKEMVIGRDASADICLLGRSISRQHARVHQRGDLWVLTDLGGRNGTLVNGEFVREVTLKHLDQIHMGEVILKFVESDAEGYLGYRIDGTRIGEEAPFTEGRIVGGYQIQRFADMLGQVATKDLSVILFGESGTGKEVFAQELHERSQRRGSFQAVNCAAIPATLIEAELFGHKRGAFSGADRDRPGIIRAADGGTLFLDEIGDMPLAAQVKLLRVLQSREVLPVGSVKPERVDVRIVCATHRDLRKLQQSDSFRGDLFARLNEFNLSLPSLRERKEDLLALCRALAKRHGRSEVRETLPFMTGLLHYDFPFNVRELEALIKRWIALSSDPKLDVEHLTDEIKERMTAYGVRHGIPGPERTVPQASKSPVSPLKPDLAIPSGSAPRSIQGAAPSEQVLRELLAHHHGNVAAVGREFGKDRVQVHRWMRRYGIDVTAYR